MGKDPFYSSQEKQLVATLASQWGPSKEYFQWTAISARSVLMLPQSVTFALKERSEASTWNLVPFARDLAVGIVLKRALSHVNADFHVVAIEIKLLWLGRWLMRQGKGRVMKIMWLCVVDTLSLKYLRTYALWLLVSFHTSTNSLQNLLSS